MSDSKPMKDVSDIRAAAALFAIEEVGYLLDRLASARVDIKTYIRDETQSAVLNGMESLSQQHDQSINHALNRLKIRASLLEPKQYSRSWLIAITSIGLLVGVLLGFILANFL